MAVHSFSAQIAEWAHKVEGAVEAVFKESVQELVSVAQTPRSLGGRLRVDTGFLRASLMASTASMPSIAPGKRPPDTAGPNSVPFDFGTIEAVIIGADIGQTIYLGYTAEYAAYREYGANGEAGDAWVRTAAQRWPAIVTSKEAELRTRLGL